MWTTRCKSYGFKNWISPLRWQQHQLLPGGIDIECKLTQCIHAYNYELARVFLIGAVRFGLVSWFNKYRELHSRFNNIDSQVSECGMHSIIDCIYFYIPYVGFVWLGESCVHDLGRSNDLHHHCEYIMNDISSGVVRVILAQTGLFQERHPLIMITYIIFCLENMGK